jgi:hypothetical protein
LNLPFPKKKYCGLNPSPSSIESVGFPLVALFGLSLIV